jgi:DNA-binding beta-propeller fold protein YncE
VSRTARFGLFALLLAIVAMAFATFRTGSSAERVWGRRGVLDGDFVRPRAATILGDKLYVVDFTARVQCYTLEGDYAGVSFTTPDFRNGRPSGLGTAPDGNLLVADSHYHALRIYSPEGTELKVLGGMSGREPGQFGYLSDCVQDADGNYYISEFGENDRITKLDRDGKFVTCWGKNGTAEGEFQRVRALAFGPDGLLYAADACNHRIQVFETSGTFVRVLGGPGKEPGRFAYPYDLGFDPDGFLYIVERGNSRVQKLTRDGTALASWGSPGRAPGQLADPWALAIDRLGRIHVIDTENHRVQRVKF